MLNFKAIVHSFIIWSRKLTFSHGNCFAFCPFPHWAKMHPMLIIYCFNYCFWGTIAVEEWLDSFFSWIFITGALLAMPWLNHEPQEHCRDFCICFAKPSQLLTTFRFPITCPGLKNFKNDLYLICCRNQDIYTKTYSHTKSRKNIIVKKFGRV